MLQLASSFLGRHFSTRLAPAAAPQPAGPRQVTTCMAKKKGGAPPSGRGVAVLRWRGVGACSRGLGLQVCGAL